MSECACVFFSFHSFFGLVCRGEWENGYDNSNGNSAEPSVFHMQTDVWMGNVVMQRRNGKCLYLKCCYAAQWTTVPVSLRRSVSVARPQRQANQWNTSVKCSDKCTHLCFYYVTQWIMQNWSSAFLLWYWYVLYYHFKTPTVVALVVLHAIQHGSQTPRDIHTSHPDKFESTHPFVYWMSCETNRELRCKSI